MLARAPWTQRRSVSFSTVPLDIMLREQRGKALQEPEIEYYQNVMSIVKAAK